MIHYTVSFEKANLHVFDVKLNLNFGLKRGQNFYLPNWIPGSYMIRDFAKNIVTLTANSKGKPVKLEKLDKSTWHLSEDVDCLEIVYQVYAWDLSVRSAHLDQQHGFFNGTSLFLGIKGYESEKHSVILEKSEHAKRQKWTVATAMPAKNVDNQGFGKYQVENYELLIDHPFEMGDLKRISFDVCGVSHEMVFTEAPKYVDWERIANDVKTVCETQVKFFGDAKPPFDRYVFMTFVLKQGFGGLEHNASTALHCSIEDLPLVTEAGNKISESYRTFLSLCCHEYFHSWNVKRIKPAKFLPIDLDKEIHTELLWFFEGITSYYDELLLARAKIINAEDYLDMLAKTITRTFRTTGRLKQTVAESSFDAWTKFYKQDENAINAIVSYYAKGAIIAFCLDLEIRRYSENKLSLDDLMRLLWEQYGKVNKGIGENTIQQRIKELVGVSFSEFFDQFLYSTQELDLKPFFTRLGISFQLVGQYLAAEKGGFSSTPKERQSLASLNINHVDDPKGVKVTAVAEAGSGAKAGLSAGDLIVAIDNIKVTSSEIDKRVAGIPVGETVSIHFFRRDRLHQINCHLQESIPNTCYLSFETSQISVECESWLNGVEP